MVLDGEFVCKAGEPCLLVNACDDGGDTAFLFGKDGVPTVLEMPCDDGDGTGEEGTDFSGINEDPRLSGDDCDGDIGGLSLCGEDT